MCLGHGIVDSVAPFVFPPVSVFALGEYRAPHHAESLSEDVCTVDRDACYDRGSSFRPKCVLNDGAP